LGETDSMSLSQIETARQEEKQRPDISHEYGTERRQRDL
jgi:hypothetical protein